MRDSVSHHSSYGKGVKLMGNTAYRPISSTTIPSQPNYSSTASHEAMLHSVAPSHYLEQEVRRNGDTKTRHRIQQACKACSLRRVRCDGERPCQTCVKTDEECVYGPKKKRGPAKGTSRGPRLQHQRRDRSATGNIFKSKHAQSPTAQTSDSDGPIQSSVTQTDIPSPSSSPPLHTASDWLSSRTTPPLSLASEYLFYYDQQGKSREQQDVEESDDHSLLHRRESSSDSTPRVFYDHCTVLHPQWPFLRLVYSGKGDMARVEAQEKDPSPFKAAYSLASLLPTDGEQGNGSRKSRQPLSTVSHVRARCHLVDSKQHPGIGSVAALVALSLQETATGSLVEADSYCSSACDMITQLVLHRQCAETAARQDRGEEKYCDRIYWCAFTVDQMLAMQLGRPPCLPSVESDRPFPATDKEADPSRYWQYLSPISSKAANFLYASQFASSSYANNMCKLAIICESITAQYTEINTKQSVRTLHKRLTEWMRDTPIALQWHPFPKRSSLPQALYQQLWAQVCMILIHRPYVFSNSDDEGTNSHVECTNAAEAIFGILQDYDESFGLACIPQSAAYFLFV